MNEGFKALILIILFIGLSIMMKDFVYFIIDNLLKNYSENEYEEDEHELCEETITFAVVPCGDGWKVENVENQHPEFVGNTKAETIKKARGIARANSPSRLVIYKKDNTINKEYTYGTSPKLKK